MAEEQAQPTETQQTPAPEAPAPSAPAAAEGQSAEPQAAAEVRRLLARTARLYPRIFARVREHFGARGTLCWLAGLAEAAWKERKR